MPAQDPYGFATLDNSLFEAEIASQALDRFQSRYCDATGHQVQPGNPAEYQEQPNKWGMELRVYFNSHVIAHLLPSMGVHVEEGRPYRSEYRYRINNNDIWWELVEKYDFVLGVNH